MTNLEHRVHYKTIIFAFLLAHYILNKSLSLLSLFSNLLCCGICKLAREWFNALRKTSDKLFSQYLFSYHLVKFMILEYT